MSALGHVLAATDLSGPSRHAVERGLRIARETGARCSVVHAFEPALIDGLVGLLKEGTPAVESKIEHGARRSHDS